jgi:hypothetical protein
LSGIKGLILYANSIVTTCLHKISGMNQGHLGITIIREVDYLQRWQQITQLLILLYNKSIQYEKLHTM